MKRWHIDATINMPDYEIPYQASPWTIEETVNQIKSLLERNGYTSVLLTIIPGDRQ